MDRNNPYNYRFEWNKGSQPWCRSREKDNLFKWLTAIFSTIGIIMVLFSDCFEIIFMVSFWWSGSAVCEMGYGVNAVIRY